MSSRLDQLIKKKAQIEAQIKAAQARERTQARKDDTRRKIIIGAIAKEHMEMRPNSPFAAELMKLLNTYVTKAKERELLGLPAESAKDGFSRAG